MSLTYPFVIPIPGQIAFSAVIVSNLLIAASCERETERVRDTLGPEETSTWWAGWPTDPTRGGARSIRTGRFGFT